MERYRPLGLFCAVQTVRRSIRKQLDLDPKQAKKLLKTKKPQREKGSSLRLFFGGCEAEK